MSPALWKASWCFGVILKNQVNDSRVILTLLTAQNSFTRSNHFRGMRSLRTGRQLFPDYPLSPPRTNETTHILSPLPLHIFLLFQLYTPNIYRHVSIVARQRRFPFRLLSYIVVRYSLVMTGILKLAKLDPGPSLPYIN